MARGGPGDAVGEPPRADEEPVDSLVCRGTENRQVGLPGLRLQRVKAAMRVCIFVDGENFRTTLRKRLGDRAEPEYVPNELNLLPLFESLAKRAVQHEHNRFIRVYWYVAERVEWTSPGGLSPEQVDERVRVANELLQKQHEQQRDIARRTARIEFR